MHSRIVQLEKEPIDHLIKASDFYDNFVGSIADYTDDIAEDARKSEIKDWFGDSAVFEYDEKTNRLTLKDKDAYFKGRYEEFIKNAKKLTTMTYEQFSSANYDAEMDVYRTRSAYDEEFGLYVANNYAGYETLDTFLRRAENGETYYVGGIVDYHF